MPLPNLDMDALFLHWFKNFFDFWCSDLLNVTVDGAALAVDWLILPWAEVDLALALFTSLQFNLPLLLPVATVLFANVVDVEAAVEDVGRTEAEAADFNSEPTGEATAKRPLLRERSKRPTPAFEAATFSSPRPPRPLEGGLFTGERLMDELLHRDADELRG